MIEKGIYEFVKDWDLRAELCYQDCFTYHGGQFMDVEETGVPKNPT